MSTKRILIEDIELLELTELFCRNQKSFYLYIANYAASGDDENKKDIKPLRLHKIEQMIDCVFSPNMHLSFYNVILDTDICNTMKQSRRDDYDKIIKQILSLASHYKCPMRLQVKPTAMDTQKLLKRYGFFELPVKNDTFQYIDFYHDDNVSKCAAINSDIKIYELDDSTQANCRMRKLEWGDVLCKSFGSINPKLYEPFYSNVWSTVEVGPSKPIRMYIAIKNDRVVGGCHASLACGVACLFNVVTLKNERGKGIGKALSCAAMTSARELNYRYMVLQASNMGSPVYKSLGFKSIPSYKLFIKLGTAAWYFRIIEMMLVMFGIEHLQRFISILQKSSKTQLLIAVILMVVMAVFIAMLFGLLTDSEHLHK